MVSCCLSNIQKPSIGAHKIEHIMGHQPIIEKQISFFDHPHCLQRQQLRVPGPCPDQVHVTGPTLFPCSVAPMLTPPLLPQHLEEVLELGELQGDVVSAD